MLVVKRCGLAGRCVRRRLLLRQNRLTDSPISDETADSSCYDSAKVFFGRKGPLWERKQRRRSTYPSTSCRTTCTRSTPCTWEIGSETYYLTDVNDRYWRAQDTAKLNEKGHYVDASELVPTVSEFLTLPFIDGKSVTDVFDQAVFYASEKA